MVGIQLVQQGIVKHSGATKLASRISRHFDLIVVLSELDAFVLESSCVLCLI